MGGWVGVERCVARCVANCAARCVEHCEQVSLHASLEVLLGSHGGVPVSPVGAVVLCSSTAAAGTCAERAAVIRGRGVGKSWSCTAVLGECRLYAHVLGAWMGLSQFQVSWRVQAVGCLASRCSAQDATQVFHIYIYVLEATSSRLWCVLLCYAAGASWCD